MQAGGDGCHQRQTVPVLLATDTVEVTVFSSAAGPTLVGAIELVSPANKDRPSQRRAFVSKCETYLQQGIGLVIFPAHIATSLCLRLATGFVGSTPSPA
jgi:hypothetical protein